MEKRKMKYIFVVGGVMSGIGKGVTVSSIGVTLQHHGYGVNIMKVDPYLNVDAGTMNPTEHGEVFVLDSGLETDQDMGNYERFLHKDLSSDDYLTSGLIYQSVIEKERNLGYDGKCVEAIPHVVDAIKERIEKSAVQSKADIHLVEIGGTLGDYQNLLFLEAARQMKTENPDDVFFILVSYLPMPSAIGEVKTRPTQNAIRTFNSYGIAPNMVVARSSVEVDDKRRQKISAACGLPKESVVVMPDVDSIWEAPAYFEKQRIAEFIIRELGLRKRKTRNVLQQWQQLNVKRRKKRAPVRIGIVGKYFQSGSNILRDAYISIIEAVRLSSLHEGANPEMTWFIAGDFEGKATQKNLKKLEKFDCLIIPGGFGTTGVDGKLAVIQHARKKKVPTLGICYGMQLMVIEYMRNVVGKRSATSLEIEPKAKTDVITIIEDQKKKLAEQAYGGTMRLGGYTAHLERGSMLRKLYGKDKVVERHRHRYELNNDYIDDLEENGMYISAYSDSGLAEAIELDPKNHPYFLGIQYHPEFTARPFNPNPLFTGLIRAGKKRARQRR